MSDTTSKAATGKAIASNAALFAEHRRELVAAAYRVLGSISDAEDVVQETWLRWAEVDTGSIEHPRAYLLKATTRQALNHLRHHARLRETYIGPWLPEPLSSHHDPAADATVEVAESVSLAMLVVLETLSPAERATFVLHDVFGLPFAEVASALDRSQASVRQLAHRAREHVEARAPRHPVDHSTHRQVTERFLKAAVGGSLESLLSLLAPDVVMYNDGGGLRKAALKPVRTPEHALRFTLGVMTKPDAPTRYELAEVNGHAAIVGYTDAGVDTLISLVLDGGVVTEIYVVRNPEKLRRVASG
ncbi:RNA polymerase sigma factor SigJ [Homoserinimonas sp. A447]